MNISSSSFNSSMMQQTQQMQRKAPPSASELSSKVMETSDLNSDSLLSIDEVNLSDETFSRMDEDGDGSLSSSELETSFSSMLESIKNQVTSPEEFGTLLTNMGLELPPAPPRSGGMPNVSEMASDIFSKNDSNEDGLLSIDELDISEELLSAMDIDEDGNITKEELTQGLKSLFESVENGERSKEDVGDDLTSLGVEPPAGGQGRGAGGGSGGGESSSEEYDEADLNEDGIVTTAEQALYDGTTSDDMADYTMKLVSTLLDALKTEDNTADSIDLSKFKSIMSMVNNETQDSSTAQKLNTYVSNLDLGLKSA